MPKAGGGNYWADDPFRSRDIERQAESNKIETNRIVADFLQRLKASGVIGDQVEIEKLLDSAAVQSALRDSRISDITEFGRMTHAEMTAICDAVRLGRSTKGSIMYVTTFPCHNCAKHIVASGIEKVVFIEPYAKSRAEHSHEDSISIGTEKNARVTFQHFEGISPRRYRDIFQKQKRRTRMGLLENGIAGFQRPGSMTRIRRPTFFVNLTPSRRRWFAKRNQSLTPLPVPRSQRQDWAPSGSAAMNGTRDKAMSWMMSREIVFVRHRQLRHRGGFTFRGNGPRFSA